MRGKNSFKSRYSKRFVKLWTVAVHKSIQIQIRASVAPKDCPFPHRTPAPGCLLMPSSFCCMTQFQLHGPRLSQGYEVSSNPREHKSLSWSRRCRHSDGVSTMLRALHSVDQQFTTHKTLAYIHSRRLIRLHGVSWMRRYSCRAQGSPPVSRGLVRYQQNAARPTTSDEM